MERVSAALGVLHPWFGNTKLFKKFWKFTLDKMVAVLKYKGFDDTKYHDKY